MCVLASANITNLYLSATPNLVRESRSENWLFVQSGSVQPSTKLDTRCHLCTVSSNECGSAFLLFYLKMNSFKFSVPFTCQQNIFL